MIPECRINSNTKELSDDLKNHYIWDDEELVSFYVVSLYTNVPVLESINICAELLFNKNHSLSFIDRETFIALAKLASCNVVIGTHDGWYKQVEGLAMGSAPAPCLANGWLSQFDSRIRGDSSLYSRYMDDIICVVNKDVVEDKLQEINSFHSSLEFTCEKEKDGAIPFLDMVIMRKEGTLYSKWYRKPTDTGLTMNFHALAPFKYKKSVIIGFVHRIFRSCSNWEMIHEGLKEAKVILTKNQYPVGLIDSVIHDTLTHLVKGGKKESTEREPVLLDETASLFNVPEKDKFNFCIQYRGKLSEKFAQSINKLNVPCKIIMTLHKTKSTIANLKSPVPSMFQSHVIYKITCPRCMACYVGQTTRHLITRFKEHVGNRGLLKKHFEECDIVPSVDLVEILGRARGEKLLTLEALFISELKPKLNTKDEYRSRELKLKF